MQQATIQTADQISTLRDWYELTKPRVVFLAVFTALVAMLVAPVWIHPVAMIMTLLGISLGAGGAGVLNMWYDRDIDPHMQRTSKRPIPSGRVQADDALVFGLALSTFGVMLTALAGNVLAASWLAFAIFFYAVIYTIYLKRRTPQNIVIGGAAGAFPPVIGWLAMTGEHMVLPWMLFLVVFLWTPPHFWALALIKKDDYAAVNIPMLPNIKGDAVTKAHIIVYAILLFVCSVSLAFIQPLGWITGIVGALSAGWFLYRCNILALDKNNTTAGKTFFVSIIYLFVIFTAILIDGLV